MKQIALILSALAVIAGVSACGSSSGSPNAATADTRSASTTPSPSPSAIDYGQQYLADVTPLNNADVALGNARTNMQNIQAYSSLSSIEQSTAAKMLRQVWPAKAEADIQAFAEAISVESGDDADVAQDFKIDPTAHSFADNKISYAVTASSMANDVSRDVGDSNKSTALAQKCRADLGLPPI